MMAKDTPEEKPQESSEIPGAGAEKPAETEPETADAASESSDEVQDQAAAETTESEATAAEEGISSAEKAPAEGAEAAEEPAESATPELTLGEGPPGQPEPTPEEKPEPVIRGQLDRFGVAMGTGRRKTSVARVRISQGEGKLTINGRSLDEYFSIEQDRLQVEAPLRATDCHGQVDVWVRVGGGGTTGQAGAIVLGIARALEAMNPDHHHALSEGGYLTRDGRMVERKKYGYKKARKSFQFSKR